MAFTKKHAQENREMLALARELVGSMAYEDFYARPYQSYGSFEEWDEARKEVLARRDTLLSKMADGFPQVSETRLRTQLTNAIRELHDKGNEGK